MFEKLLEINDEINRLYEKETKGYTIALLGNPNVGKSTVFNELTGMKQHTGNWPGKTVELAKGYFTHQKQIHEMVDLPGTYSLLAHSSEEEVARNYICFEQCDVCLVVCDATCLERNLNLVLQTLEITNKVIVVLNLMDEAKQKNIVIDTLKLQEMLGVTVVEMSASHRKGFKELKEAIEDCGKRLFNEEKKIVKYDERIEQSICKIANIIHASNINHRFLALKLLDPQVDSNRFYESINNTCEVRECVEEELEELQKHHAFDNYEEKIVCTLQNRANKISEECIMFNNASYLNRDMKIDRILTSKGWGIVWMVALLSIIFWITISAANVPSKLLTEMFANIEVWLHARFLTWHVNSVLQGLFIDGMLRTCGWVISVMLPPMAIFFPLFTILEDFGYLPRVAFNLDGFFQKANACGKQALTMAMGFGCNAVGVAGARIIDSQRERLLAIVTNVFVPCNGRFPTLISVITMFFTGMFVAPWGGIISTLMLTGIIVFGVMMTFFVSKLLSKTLLKGIPSSFSLELPPYRKPQFRKVIVRSIFDRTLFVLGRAICVALPAGAIIWLLANIMIQDASLLFYISNFLDPFAQLMGLDGVILLAFILGFPANEIVVPIMIMAYMANGSMVDIADLDVLKNLFVENGWTWITAICMLLFSLVHFPCATTLLTIKKETNSWKWTILSFLIPTILGIALCMSVHGIAVLIALI